MIDIKNEFPLDERLCYVNHAAVAPWPERTVRRVMAFANQNLTHGAQHYPQWLEVEAHLREQTRQLLHATSVDDIALVKNTSEALSMVAHGIDWASSDNVVIPAQEFPSNRIVWESLKGFGVEIRQVDTRSSDDPEQALFNHCDQNTRLISVSSVQYDIGLRLDLARLGAFCSQNRILFCVDAIQSLGVVPMDVEAIHADFVMADGHKWLLGPEGLAIFYSRAAARQQLALHEFGWHMLQDPYMFDRTEWAIADSARRFECGSPNMLGIHALDASLSIFSDAGMQTISRKIFNNTSYLIDNIKSISGAEIRTPTDARRHAGIVSVALTNHDTQAVYDALMKQGVICALRGGAIRFSPHFYTPQTVLDRTLTMFAEQLT